METQQVAGDGMLTVLVLGLLALAVVGVVVLLLRRPAGRLEGEFGLLARAVNTALTELGQVRQALDNLGLSQAELRQQLGGLRDKVHETTGDLAQRTLQVQAAIQQEILAAKDLVREVRTELTERRKRDEEIERAVRHLETVLAGSPSKGAAGENILDEAFSGFPPEMLERNFRVRGKVVEYALVLGGGNRRMPIDSKWPATAAVERLQTATVPDERQKILTEVRAAVRRKVLEVAQYIDPLTTTDKAIAVVPDSVYPYCGELAFDAYRRGVIIMPYSMIVPYILNLYNLHLKYARSVDLETLDHALADIERNVDSLEKVLEDRVQRGATMVGNAYTDARHIVSQIRLALGYVRALPAVGERLALAAGEDGRPGEPEDPAGGAPGGDEDD
ncbi:MAG: DNA recombination protein RmuC [Bacillota bacterium]